MLVSAVDKIDGVVKPATFALAPKLNLDTKTSVSKSGAPNWSGNLLVPAGFRLTYSEKE